MNIKTIYIILATCLGMHSTLAQSLEDLLHRLPSQKEYFVPQSITDSTLLAADSSTMTLIDYLKAGVSAPQLVHTTLTTRLSLPLVVQPVQSIQPLGIAAPELRLFPKVELYKNYAEQILSPYRVAHSLAEGTMQYVQQRNLAYSSYTEQALAKVREQSSLSQATANIPTPIVKDLKPSGVKNYAEQFIVSDIERRYWIPGFESSVQFSQNYISDNWHKGGNSNLNLSMRTYFSLLYSKDKIQWLNELESKLGLYTADVEKQGARYRISEDRLRLHSNYGIKMNKRWSYTLDGELRTQLFNIYKGENQVLQSAPLAPVRTNIGVGLQYSYSTKSKTRYGRKFKISANFAPFSHNWRWTARRDIDLARHGFEKGKFSQHTFGSTLRGQMQWDINMDLSWSSRVYFNTSYQNVEAEWENTLTMRISRYFSTRINIHLRFDDSAKPSPNWNKYLQINELLSFGFNYKL